LQAKRSDRIAWPGTCRHTRLGLACACDCERHWRASGRAGH
jgi:hypothetical protein